MLFLKGCNTCTLKYVFKYNNTIKKGFKTINIECVRGIRDYLLTAHVTDKIKSENFNNLHNMKPSYTVVKRIDLTHPNCHSNDNPWLSCFSNLWNIFLVGRVIYYFCRTNGCKYSVCLYTCYKSKAFLYKVFSWLRKYWLFLIIPRHSLRGVFSDQLPTLLCNRRYHTTTLLYFLHNNILREMKIFCFFLYCF